MLSRRQLLALSAAAGLLRCATPIEGELDALTLGIVNGDLLR